MSNRREAALDYHARGGRPGKIQVVSTKPTATQIDLSLAYTPGVAEVCKEIERRAEAAYEYTTKGNLVAVISNGTAVLGLGDIGPLAGKPVMEGKGVLFKRFADIDVFDIEINEPDPEKLIAIVNSLEPTFGGINLEDIKAPECFEVETRLKAMMNIPVFHDDQHGTAIITAAGLINALEIQKKKIEDVRLVVSGAGAAAIACVNLFIDLGMRRKNVIMVDTKGVVSKAREAELNKYKKAFMADTKATTLEQVVKGADVFLGVSAAGMLTPKMVLSMADRPIVFALANPDPEIGYWEAKKVRDDIVVATGRSDYPNQVNNVLGFPFIFRGALDVRAKTINTAMVKAASHALARLAREPVPEAVMRAYGGIALKFGPDYIIPKPFDHRVLLWVAPAVAKAAMDSGVARKPIKDFDEYGIRLERILGPTRELIRSTMRRARTRTKIKRVVFPDGDDATIIRAAEIIAEEGIAQPVLLGPGKQINELLESMNVDRSGIEVFDQLKDGKVDAYVDRYWKLRHRDGFTRHRAWKRMQQRTFYGAMMVSEGEADAFVGGYFGRSEAATLETLREIIGLEPGVFAPLGFSIMLKNAQMLILGDNSFIENPTAQEVALIAHQGARMARWFGLEPRVGLLSYSNFGDHPGASAMKMAEARKLLASDKSMNVDGELTVGTALDATVRETRYPFSTLDGDANVLIFPNLDSARISTDMMANFGGAELIGPLLVGLRKPVAVLPSHLDAADIVHLTTMTLLMSDDKLAAGKTNAGKARSKPKGKKRK